MGLLVHVLSIFTGFWAPLIIYIVKRDSKFISFHALQSLLWHLLYMIVSFIFVFGMIFVFMGTVISRVAAQHGPGAAPPPGIFLVAPLFWMGIFVIWAINLMIGIVFAIKANGGEWATFPLVGKWALRTVTG